MPVGDPSLFVQHTEGDLAERFLVDVASNQPGWTVGACLLLPRWRATTQRDFAVRLARVLHQGVRPGRGRGAGLSG